MGITKRPTLVLTQSTSTSKSSNNDNISALTAETTQHWEWQTLLGVREAVFEPSNVTHFERIGASYDLCISGDGLEALQKRSGAGAVVRARGSRVNLRASDSESKRIYYSRH